MAHILQFSVADFTYCSVSQIRSVVSPRQGWRRTRLLMLRLSSLRKTLILNCLSHRFTGNVPQIVPTVPWSRPGMRASDETLIYWMRLSHVFICPTMETFKHSFWNLAVSVFLSRRSGWLCLLFLNVIAPDSLVMPCKSWGLVVYKIRIKTYTDSLIPWIMTLFFWGWQPL